MEPISGFRPTHPPAASRLCLCPPFWRLMKMSRLSVVTLAAAGFALAACADSTKVTEPTGSSLTPASPSFELAWENPRHEMPTQSQAAEHGKPNRGGGGSG